MKIFHTLMMQVLSVEQRCNRVNVHDLCMYLPSFFMKSQVELYARECPLTGCVYLGNLCETVKIHRGCFLSGGSKQRACLWAQIAIYIVVLCLEYKH